MSEPSNTPGALGEWVYNTVPDFLRDHPEYHKNDDMTYVLDRRVRELQVKAKNPYDPCLLSAAHEAVLKSATEFALAAVGRRR